ncbi:Slp family lipoprotein [Methylicorpusculum sp.]|nr:Slp family lipoprotein [Methylicorpusculum sp.]MDP2180139.1 Slp family lipoprotein [Methylicorpusculum sp.]MDP3530692.1 Slp family lipoprotein [Methylicorpusculum sp.]
MRYSWLFVILLLNLQGCSNLPVALQNPPVPDLTYQDITMQPNGHLNRPVRWGGTILEVRNEEQYTQIEVLYYPLSSSGRPQSNSATEGRFLIQSPRFLDPAVYQKDLDITVAGLFTGESEKRIGNKTLKIPIIQENTLYLWPKQQPQYYYWNEFGYGPYYSPFYFGFRPYRYYGYPYGRYYW